MLIGKSMDQITSITVSEMIANRLADKVRNIWLENRTKEVAQWEETFCEDFSEVQLLQLEGFPGLIGIDYIFKWWGTEDSDELAGELEVIWKTNSNQHIFLYKTWIRFASRDFILGHSSEESKKREINRKEFREAFSAWKKCYMIRN